MSGRYIPSPLKHASPLLRVVVDAARAECSPERTEHLIAFIALVAGAGASVTGRSRARSAREPAIQSLARAHARIDRGLTEWRTARGTSAGDRRDDPAAFYAGVALGVAFTLR